MTESEQYQRQQLHITINRALSEFKKREYVHGRSGVNVVYVSGEMTVT